MIRYLIILIFFVANTVSAEESSKYYGVNINPNIYNLSSDQVLNLIKNTGFNSFRQELTWGNIEQQKKTYTIKGKNIIRDDIINKSTYYGLSPILILVYSNNNYNNGNYPVSSESQDGFADYSTWIAKRYKGKVKIYEIWNEWTQGTGMANKGFKIPSEEKYFELVKKTSIALKKVDPNIKVIAGSFNPMSDTGRHLSYNDNEWFIKLVKLGILNYIDGVSIHPYSFLNKNVALRTPEANFERIIQLQNVLKKASNSKKDIPIYITEMGVSNFRSNGGASEASTADFIIKYTALVTTLPYIKGIWWYDLIDDGTKESEKENNFGFYKNDKQEKKVVEPFKNLMRIILKGDLHSCNTKIEGDSIVISSQSHGNNKNCMSWDRDGFEQYNRLRGDFNNCDKCNDIKFNK